MRNCFPLVIFFGLLLSAVAQESSSTEDRIEIEGGAVLTGTIVEVSRDTIRLNTVYAGTIEVDVLQVRKVRASRDLSGQLPGSLLSPDPEPKAPVESREQSSSPTKKVATKQVRKHKDSWEIEAGANLKGSSGNSEKFDLGLAFDARWKREFDRLDLLGRYSYGTNRGDETSNELILGARYTNFFYDHLGFFIREELEHDNFEGVVLRTTSAAGLSWKFHENESIELEARSGFSYRHELYEDEMEDSFPGMDFGLDLQWKFAPWVQFKGTYEFVPSFSDTEDFIVTQDSGFNIPLAKASNWKLRLGLVSKYNNQPEVDRDSLDHRYYARLMATWK